MREQNERGLTRSSLLSALRPERQCSWEGPSGTREGCGSHLLLQKMLENDPEERNKVRGEAGP